MAEALRNMEQRLEAQSLARKTGERLAQILKERELTNSLQSPKNGVE